MAEFLNTFLALTAGGSVLVLLLIFLRYVLFRTMPATAYYYLWILVLLRFALPIPGVLPADRPAVFPSLAAILPPTIT